MDTAAVSPRPPGLHLAHYASGLFLVITAIVCGILGSDVVVDTLNDGQYCDVPTGSLTGPCGSIAAIADGALTVILVFAFARPAINHMTADVDYTKKCELNTLWRNWTALIAALCNMGLSSFLVLLQINYLHSMKDLHFNQHQHRVLYASARIMSGVGNTTWIYFCVRLVQSFMVTNLDHSHAHTRAARMVEGVAILRIVYLVSWPVLSPHQLHAALNTFQGWPYGLVMITVCFPGAIMFLVIFAAYLHFADRIGSSWMFAATEAEEDRPLLVLPYRYVSARQFVWMVVFLWAVLSFQWLEVLFDYCGILVRGIVSLLIALYFIDVVRSHSKNTTRSLGNRTQVLVFTAGLRVAEQIMQVVWVFTTVKTESPKAIYRLIGMGGLIAFNVAQAVLLVCRRGVRMEGDRGTLLLKGDRVVFLYLWNFTCVLAALGDEAQALQHIVEGQLSLTWYARVSMSAFFLVFLYHGFVLFYLNEHIWDVTPTAQLAPVTTSSFHGPL